MEIQGFLFVTWSLYWNVLWLCGWGPLILRHQLAKFGIHKPSESRDKRFLFVTWPQYRSVTWLCEWGLLILNHHPVRFGIHRSYETGANSVCSISSDSSSNSNSNVEVPMPRFINGHQAAILQPCYNVLIIFASQHVLDMLWCIKSRTCLFLNLSSIVSCSK